MLLWAYGGTGLFRSWQAARSFERSIVLHPFFMNLRTPHLGYVPDGSNCHNVGVFREEPNTPKPDP